jgi:hypothetical protein
VKRRLKENPGLCGDAAGMRDPDTLPMRILL